MDFPHSDDGINTDALLKQRAKALYLVQRQQFQQGNCHPVRNTLPCPRFREDTDENGYWN